MPECRILVVGDSIFFMSVAAQLVKSQFAELECHPAEDAIHALVKIHEIRPHVIVADTAHSNLWGVDFVPFIRRCFPEISLVAIGDAATPRAAADAMLHGDDPEAAKLRRAIEDLVRRRPQYPAAGPGPFTHSA